MLIYEWIHNTYASIFLPLAFVLLFSPMLWASHCIINILEQSVIFLKRLGNKKKILLFIHVINVPDALVYIM